MSLFWQTLFAPLFPSTKSAKVMCDPSTGLSRGYGFVRFGEEPDMQRALLLGANSHSGLLLHGRTIRISEASGSAATGGVNPNETSVPQYGGRERVRSRSDEALAAQQGYFPPYSSEPLSPHDPNAPQFLDNPYGNSQPTSPYSAPPFASSFSSYSNGAAQAPPYPSPGVGLGDNSAQRRTPRENGSAGRSQIPSGSIPPGSDPNNTTVFVGGLPACISEETLKVSGGSRCPGLWRPSLTVLVPYSPSSTTLATSPTARSRPERVAALSSSCADKTPSLPSPR